MDGVRDREKMMNRAGGMCLPRSDTYFANILEANNGRFDDAALVRALQILPPMPCTALDIGAHVGTWSAVMADHFDKVYAFEPVWENFDCLQENTKALKNVKSYCIAMGNSTTVVAMEQGKEGNSGTWRIDPEGCLRVCIMQVDDLRMHDIDLIKIDTEGYELEVLKGAQKTLDRCKPLIIVEENGLIERYNYNSRDLSDWLALRGYCRFGGCSRDVIYGPMPIDKEVGK